MNAQLETTPENVLETGPETGREDPETTAIKEAFEEIQSLKLKRKAVNEEVAAVVAELGSFGIPPAAVKLVAALAKLDNEERAEIEAAVQRCREAMGWNAQQSLF